MDKPMTFNEWLGTQGNMALLHANCCRIAYEAGQQSQQAKVEELQKKNAWLSDVAERENKRANKLKEEHVSTTILLGKVEQQKAELQKRVGAAERKLQLVQECIEENSYTKWPSDVRLIQVSDLEQALKGGGCQ
ncbi:hypothetical protein ACWL9T_003626 [Acinetobacter baumannii]|uniref:hypothetical protein n=1 Tax=Acinetobacter baumannii TaxID=470 RepID=UPI00070815CF|nr:hypothetical protein [Acinetobacter baumannii]EHZ6835365.1 hypothetical protein [Acinetobacter baumannii]EHZ7476675.1 hypothetical protein [Acinetobacter baumannii]EIT1517867.1 hypothetical protein [Acinetobacter baumannii]EIT1736110.1 hypothetical protein [Acinetobacter baumannii]EIT1748886.1 hypothetical protein [Acinetobacter baumannii]